MIQVFTYDQLSQVECKQRIDIYAEGRWCSLFAEGVYLSKFKHIIVYNFEQTLSIINSI
jgi:hypothetical protein